MRRRTRIALSVACGVLAMMLAATYADAAQQEAEAARAEALERYGGEVASLVVAKRGLTAGDVLSQSDVEVREWLVDLAPGGAVSNLDDIVGMRLTSAVAAGSPLCEVDFAGTEGTLEVPEGRVAVSVKLTDKTGVTASLARGSRLLAYEVREGGTSLISGDASVVGSASGGAGSSSLTIAVAPSVVARVLAASSEGTLRLVVPAQDVDEGELSGSVTEVPAETGTEAQAATEAGAEAGGESGPGAPSEAAQPAGDAETGGGE